MRIVAPLLLVGEMLLVGACAGNCRPDYVRQLDAVEAKSLAGQAARADGYDLSTVQPADVEVRYMPATCQWSVLYRVHKDQLPVGPLVIVDDRTRSAGTGPEM